ncbi:MAG: FtsW/RodA/SpoVE family cell cycle protein [Candidatus Neomarinimicrobiota bacterium]|nr:FtsW/RodA/SpoVE family cell cycle protein [Candidatus Neomarinimicrobiota bacterium]
MNLFDKLSNAPFRWLLIVFALNIFGMVALYSISQGTANFSFSSRFVKFLLWFIPAFGAFVFFFVLPKKYIHEYAYVVAILSVSSLFFPYLTGPVAGTYRWVSIGGVSFQPAEMLKWVMVIALARYLSDHRLQLKKVQSLLIPIIAVLIPAFFIAKQPDLGSAIIVVAPLIPLLYWVGAQPFHIFLLLAPVISVVTAFNYYSFTIWILLVGSVIYLSRTTLRFMLMNFFGNISLGLLTPLLWNSLTSYQQGRILVFLDITRDPLGAAYQVIQSQTAIGSGGLWGKGFGMGTQTHLKFLPEQETDFIFSVIGEEFGFVAVVTILILFAILVLSMVQRAYRISERFPSLVLFGIATIFMSHIFVNVGMTVNLLPVKGLPLPFLSYGGTFLVSCYAMLGLAMNMSVEADG